MTGTDFEGKVEILGALYLSYKDVDSEFWNEFFDWGDLGLPLAGLAKCNFALVQPDGRSLIEDCWSRLCDMVDVDPNGTYGDLEDLISRSPKELDGPED